MVLQPDMVSESMHAWMAFGLAVMSRREQGVDGDRGEGGHAEGGEKITCFHFNFSFVWVALYCSTRLLYLSYPGKWKTPQKSASPSHWLSRPLAYFVQKTIFKPVALEISKIVEGFPPR
jgi:hypothetical protein